MRQNITKLSAAVLMVSAITGAAHAGGFSRGTADTAIIYEDGTVDFRVGGTFVSPHRSFDTIAGAAATDAAYSNDYWIPSASVKVRLSDSFSCAATYTQPFGGSSTYGSQSQAADKAVDVTSPGWPVFFAEGNAVKKASFTADEAGGTCAYNTQIGSGNVYFIGGAFVENFKYTEVKDFGTLSLTDQSAFGYRIGAAYEIKEYALRAEIMYRSQVEHDPVGQFVSAAPLSVAPLNIPVGTKLSASGVGALPQSLEVNFQTGIAPDWLAFGSVKWTDWSVFDVLKYNIPGLGALGAQKKEYYWQDGWTVSGGIGHKFTDDISGAVSLTWDRGVSTGADIMTDTWTLGAGSQIKAGPGTLRLGAAVSYLTSGEQSIAEHAAFNATAGNDWAYALNASYIIKF